MKHLILAALFALPTAGWAQSVEGLWRTEQTPKGASLDVRVAPCGASMCGTVEKAYHTKRDDWVGFVLFSDMAPKQDGSFAGGEIHAIDDGKTYDGSIRLAGPALEIQGCVLMMCRSQHWTRVE